MVEEDEGIPRWCDQGVGDDDDGVGRRAADGNHDDSDRSRVLADGCERGQRMAKPGVCAAADHTALIALTRYEANDIVANSRKNPLEAWRRLQKRYDPMTGGRKNETFCDHFSWTVHSSGTVSGDRTLGVLPTRTR